MADNKSITAAADVLGLKKVTVSNKMRALEKALGLKLLDKSRNKIILTEAGEKYYEYAKEIVNIALEAHEGVSKKINAHEGTLRVTTTPNIGWLLFDDLFAHFLKQYPGINLEINFCNEYIDIIKQKYDVAIRMTTTPFKDSNLIAKNLVDVEVGLYATKGYLAKTHKIKSIADLSHHRAIQTSHRNFFATENGKRSRLVFESKMFINSMTACLQATNENLGIGLFPTSAFTGKLENTGLVRVLPESQLEPSTLYLVYSGNDLRPPKLSVFLDFINEWKKSFL